MNNTQLISSLSVEDIENVMKELGQPAYRGRQLFHAIYQEGLGDWTGNCNLPKKLLSQLGERFAVGLPEILDLAKSKDGSQKLLLGLRDGEKIETALIREKGRWTLCLSTQVGCGYGCEFCLTARGGVKRSLEAGEIADQVRVARSLLPEGEKLANLVFMGMGEPLANFDNLEKAINILIDERGFGFNPKKVTVSTVGIVPVIRKMAKRLPVNLAISLNAPNDAIRGQLMPINKKFPIDELLQACREFPLEKRRRITFEYALLGQVNDRKSHARELGKLLRGIKCKVNLIPFNPFPGAPFERPDPDAVEAFRQELVRMQIDCYVRYSKGRDIMAACGQLSLKSADAIQGSGAPNE